MEWVNDNNKTFTNPYNFVSLDSDCKRESDYVAIKNEKNLFTGYISIEIKTETPIFIPNTTNNDAFRETDNNENNPIKSYDFFSYEDISNQDRRDKWSTPVIPGSEIRGVIRSAFETVTSSCLSTLDEERLMYKRTVTPAEKKGRLLHDKTTDTWEIKPCERIGVNTKGRNPDPNGPFNLSSYYEGQEVYIKISTNSYRKRIRGNWHNLFRVVEQISDNPQNGFEKGYIHHGEPFGNRKHHESVFIEENLPAEKVDKDAVKRLLENIRLYKDDAVNIHLKQHKQHNGYQKLKSQSINDLDGALVYYKLHNNIYYLSPSAISREVFKNRLKDLAQSFTPCASQKNLCAACALFGMVKEKESVSSRVRFTDALPAAEKNPKDYFDNHVIFEELASPKPSATEFYLKKPASGADIWNYDYAVENQADIGGYTSKIRGRKFYWHKKIAQYAGIAPGQDRSDRNVGGRPVKKGESFEFRIYFNDITENELKKLVWILRPGGEKSKNYHKTGMGKPLGLGSIKIDVKKIMQRKIEFDDTNKTIKYYFDDILNEIDISNARNLLGCSQKVYNEFLAITDFDNAPDDFSYPVACDRNGEKHIYSWFGANKNHRDKPRSTQFKPIINNPLPEIAVTDGSTSSLPAYREE
jgi:CRISPR-associated protein (TIGR03986 family)